MRRYEYLTQDFLMKGREPWDAILNRMGSDGWELVSAVPNVGHNLGGNTETKDARLLFKRELPASGQYGPAEQQRMP